MKLLLSADAVGGVFTYALELARGLAARGVRVVLATEGAHLSADQARAVAEVPGLVHRGSAYRLEWMESPWDDVARAGEWLLALERREAPDVVHLGSFAHGALPFRAPALVVGHSCVASWLEAVRGEAPGPEWVRYLAAVRAGLRGAAAVVAPSAAMARALERHHGPLGPVTVIPNGRDPARFPPGEKEPLVLGAGRLWDEAKNAAALAAAAPELPWPVAIAGEAAAPARPPPGPSAHPEHRDARSPSRSRGARGSAPGTAALAPGPAHLLGRLAEPDLAAWLARAAIFAHPARYEPFGLAVLEAALAGCALVLGDLESLRENWDGAALFVDPIDRGALAGALVALAAEPRRRAALAAAARARALDLGADRMTDAYLALHHRLAARREKGRP